MVSKYNIFWRPKDADEGVMGNAMDRLREVGDMMVEEVKKGIELQGHVGKITRPVYKTGKYAGKYWTARRPGSTLYSARMVEEEGSGLRNIRIAVGSTKVYYVKMLERKKPFFRPAMNRGKRKAKKIFRGQ